MYKRQVLRFAKENAQLLEELMEKHTGVRRKLVCGPANSGEEKAKQTSMEELAGELEKRLGLNVELK